MSEYLSSQDLFNLSKSFHGLSGALGDYRYSNWDTLTPSQRDKLEDMQWTLLNTSSDLNSKSGILKVKLLEADIEILRSCTADMQKAIKKISNIKRVINIASMAVAFGGSIYLAASTGNVVSMIAAAKSLVQEINS
jgi:hypothetical protein